jgi:Flp pilus assembly protein TadG
MKTLNGFSRRLRRSEGQALIEFILILPMVFLLILNLVNFGGFFYAWITVANAARAGADYAVLGFSSVGVPATPSSAQIQDLITKDIASLPNASSLIVQVCQNNGGTVTPGCSPSPDRDPEPSGYVLTSIDVTYTYKPFIQGFTFPKLGVYLTIPPTTVYQRAEMRSYQ